jgi:hypothetical protein
MEITNDQFYQIRLFSRGKVEVFQRVFHHRIGIMEGNVQGIYVKYSASLNTGNCTHSFRPLDGVYDIQVIDEMDYFPTSDNPLGDGLIVHGLSKEVSNG